MTFDKKIILFLGLFIAFMVTLGVVMIWKTSESAEYDYYAKDLGYQQAITAQKNALNLGIKPQITHHKEREMLELHLPKAPSALAGKVFFQKPDNQKIDFSIVLGLDKEGKQYLPIQNLTKGVWYIWIEGRADKTAFKTELTKINL